MRAYLIKGSGDDNLVGIVWPGEGRKMLTGRQARGGGRQKG